MSIRLKRRSATPLFESLETRAMLAADLSGAFTLPDAVVSVNSGQVQPVTLHVTNNGDVAAAKFKIDYFLYTGDFDADTATLLSSYTRNPALKPNASVDIHSNLNIPASNAAGSFKIAAVIDSAETVFESNESNNTASTGTVNVTQPDYDLTASFGDVKLASSVIEHTAAAGTAKINLAVAGSAALPKKLTVGLNVVLRPVGEGDDVIIGSVPRQSLSGLTSAKPKSANVKLAVPLTLAAGSYTLVVVVDPATQALPLGALAETNEGNNSATTPNFTFTSAAAFSDVGLSSATHAFPSPSTAGDTAQGTFVIRNFGNTDASGAATVTFFARKDGETDRSLGSVNVNLNLKAGASTAALKVNLTLPGTLTNNSTYDIVAVFTPPNGLGDVAGNNTASAGAAVTVTVPPQPEPAFPAVGDQVKFTDEDTDLPPITASITVHKFGNFVDGNGRTGTYEMLWLAANQTDDPGTLGKVTTVALTYTDGQGGIAAFTLIATNSAVKALNNKTIHFTLTSTAATDGTATGSTEGTVFFSI